MRKPRNAYARRADDSGGGGGGLLLFYRFPVSISRSVFGLSPLSPTKAAESFFYISSDPASAKKKQNGGGVRDVLYYTATAFCVYQCRCLIFSRRVNVVIKLVPHVHHVVSSISHILKTPHPLNVWTMITEQKKGGAVVGSTVSAVGDFYTCTSVCVWGKTQVLCVQCVDTVEEASREISLPVRHQWRPFVFFCAIAVARSIYRTPYLSPCICSNVNLSSLCRSELLRVIESWYYFGSSKHFTGFSNAMTSMFEDIGMSASIYI